MSLKKRYIVFEDCNLDFTYQQVAKFKKMWQQGYSTGSIAKKLHCKIVESDLLATDLLLKGKIKNRVGGLAGTKELPDDKIRIEV